MERYYYRLLLGAWVGVLVWVVALAMGIWLLIGSSTTRCFHLLFEVPVVAISVLLVIFCVIGSYAALHKLDWLIVFYILVVSILSVALFVSCQFAIGVTNDGIGEHLPGKAYKEYRLGNSSSLRPGTVSRTWNKVATCLVRHDFCRTLIDDATTSSDAFYRSHLTPIQSGCCKPSNDCNFTYVAPTKWAKISNTSTNQDCAAWNNNPDLLCYNCQSCMAGLLDSIKRDWRILGFYVTTCFYFIFFFNVVAFCFWVKWKLTKYPDAEQGLPITKNSDAKRCLAQKM